MIILWKEEFSHFVLINSNEINLYDTVDTSFAKDKTQTKYFHYFSQDCKDARANMEHLIKIIEEYHDNVDFYIIGLEELNAEAFRKRYELPSNIEIIEDRSALITNKHQIKATPYALITNSSGKLIFKGNYFNTKGLCSPNDIRWSAPALALRSILKNVPLPFFTIQQTSFRGCEINQLSNGS